MCDYIIFSQRQKKFGARFWFVLLHFRVTMLGVTVRPVLLDERRAVGLLVLEVATGGSAEAASILIGDVLLGANGRRFRSADELSDAIEGAAGGVLVLQFLRGDRRAEREVAVRLARRGAEAA